MVSVLITVYNDENNIANAIKSILNQSFQDFEIIVINDGSTDGTLKVLEELKKNNNEKIHIFNQQNQGTAMAANSGIKLCGGKYIARLDSDDVSYDNRLEIEVDFLEKNPDIGLVGGGCHITDNAGRIIGKRNIHTNKPYKTLINRCIYQQSDIMFRKDILSKIDGDPYRSKFKGAEDYDLWLRVSEISKIVKLDTMLGIWRLNGGGYTLSRKKEQLEAIKELRKMAKGRRKGKKDWYDAFTPQIKDVRHRTQISMAEYDLCVAQVLIKELRLRDAREQLFKHRKVQDDWQTVKRWYCLTFLPKLLLYCLFSIREFVLTNTSLEFR